MALDAERACVNGGTGPNIMLWMLALSFTLYILFDSALTWVVVFRKHTDVVLHKQETKDC